MNLPTKKPKSTSSLSTDVLLNNIAPFLPLKQVLTEIPLLCRACNEFVDNQYSLWLRTYFSSFWTAYQEEKQLSAKEVVKSLVQTRQRVLQQLEGDAAFEKIISQEPFYFDICMFFKLHKPLEWIDFFCDPEDEFVRENVQDLFQHDDDGELVPEAKRISNGFAESSTGAKFAFWEKVPGERVQIIFLGDESEAAFLSRNFDDFVRMVASGFSELGLWVAGGTADQVRVRPMDEMRDMYEEGMVNLSDSPNFALFQKILERIGLRAFTLEELYEYWQQILEKERLHESLFAIRD